MSDFATSSLPACCWDIPHTPEAVAKARALVRETLTEWGMPALADDAELIVTELVTNAIRHGAPPVILALSTIGPAALIGSVADGGPNMPHLLRREPDLDATSGRGLAIVRALVNRWGVWPDSGGIGKTIWFALTGQPEEEP
jgi:anti-sigma regulatory factor (Ser/Thr protein kinase)